MSLLRYLIISTLTAGQLLLLQHYSSSIGMLAKTHCPFTLQQNNKAFYILFVL